MLKETELLSAIARCDWMLGGQSWLKLDNGFASAINSHGNTVHFITHRHGLASFYHLASGRWPALTLSTESEMKPRLSLLGAAILQSCFLGSLYFQDTL